MNAQTQTATITEAPRRSLLIDMATRYGMEPKTFADTLRATVIPTNTTNEEFAAFLMVAKEYNLNPLLKEIYAFPKRGGGIQPIVSIDGWCNLVNSHSKLNGIEFDDHLDKDGKVTAITARIWRKDREKPIVVTEYMVECTRATDTWKQYPRRMLRHKALIQCARYAFGFAGIVDPDEAERMGVDVSPMRNAPRVSDGPPAPTTIGKIEHKPQAATDLELVESGRDNGERVEWGEHSETTIAQAEPAQFNEAEWLRELEGALSGCEDYSSAGEQQRDLMMPWKKLASPAGWKKAEKLVADALNRINTILAAG